MRHGNKKGLEAIELYEQAFFLIYKKVQGFPRWHGRLRDALLDRIVGFPGYLYTASKTNQASKIYEADARLAELRALIRMAAAKEVKALTPDDAAAIQNWLQQVGARLNEWQEAIHERKRHGRDAREQHGR